MYNYKRDMDSHMMKNTEWGAVAYLSLSNYGINGEVRINNSSTFLINAILSIGLIVGDFNFKLEAFCRSRDSL